jgi:hypothetical protein
LKEIQSGSQTFVMKRQTLTLFLCLPGHLFYYVTVAAQPASEKPVVNTIYPNPTTGWKFAAHMAVLNVNEMPDLNKIKSFPGNYIK